MDLSWSVSIVAETGIVATGYGPSPEDALSDVLQQVDSVAASAMEHATRLAENAARTRAELRALADA